MNEFHEYLDKRYALALYEVAEEKGKIDEYINELKEIIDVINYNSDFLLIIKHPELSTSKKKDIFESIFKGKIENDVLSFLMILIEKNRFMELERITEEIKKIYLEKKCTITAEVTTVVPLNEQERNSLTNKLQKKYNRNVILKEELDSQILGGVLVRIGNEIIDGTIRTKLEQIRKLSLKMK